LDYNKITMVRKIGDKDYGLYVKQFLISLLNDYSLLGENR